MCKDILCSTSTIIALLVWAIFNIKYRVTLART